MRRPGSFVQRINLELTGAGLLVLIIAASSLLVLVMISRSGEDASDQAIENLLDVERLHAITERKVALGRGLLIERNPALEGHLVEARAGMLQLVQQLRPASPAEVDAIAVAERAHHDALWRLLATRAAGTSSDTLARRFTREVVPRGDALVMDVRRLETTLEEQLAATRAAHTLSEQRTTRWVLIIAGASLLIGLALIRTLHRLTQARRQASLQTERARRRYAELIEGLGDTATWEVDRRTRELTFASPGASELIGHPLNPSHLDARRIFSAIPPEDLERLSQAMHELAPGQSKTLEHRMIAPNGRQRWMRTTMRLARSPEDPEVVYGMAIDITRLHEADQELRTRAHEQAVVADLGQRALRIDDPDTLLAEAAREVAATLGVGYSSVFELRPGGHELLLRAGAGWPADSLGQVRLALSPDSALTRALRTPEGVIELPAESDPQQLPERLGRLGVVTSLWAPIEGPEQSFGVIAAHATAPGGFSHEDIHFLQAVANVLATALERRQSERRLRESELQLRLLVESVEDYAIVMLDLEGRISSWNTGAERITGFRASEIIGENWAVFFPPSDRRANRPRALLESAAGHGQIESKGWRLRRNGEAFWAEEAFSVVYAPSGQPVGFSFIARDATERHRLEQAQRLLLDDGEALSQSLDYEHTLSVIAALGVPRFGDLCVIAVFNPDRSVRVETAAAIPQVEQSLRRHFLRSPPDPRASTGLGKVLGSGRPVFVPRIDSGHLDDFGHAPPGQPSISRALGLRSLITVPLLGRSGILGAISFGLRGDQRRYDQRDLELALDLARRAALALDNARLYREAQEAVRARDQFLSIASHELKTPITSFQLQVQSLNRVLARDPGASIPLSRLKPKLLVLRRQSERLGRLINNLLDISRITSGQLRLHPEPLDLAAMAKEAIERMGDDLARAGCKVALDAPEPVIGEWDRPRLEQVVQNLLSNALKYGAGNAIDLSVRRDGEHARIQVRDRGIGIAQADRARIFERFERAVSERHYGGLGLGLWISRQIVLALGGDVQVDSTPGEGSVFTVTLPLPTVARPAPEPDDQLAPEQPGL